MLCIKPKYHLESLHVTTINVLSELPSNKKVIKARPISEENYKKLKERENDTSPFGLVKRNINQIFGYKQLSPLK